MKYLKLFEDIDNIDFNDWDEEEYEMGVDPSGKPDIIMSKLKNGDNVICINDCSNTYNEKYTLPSDEKYLPVKRGEIKIVDSLPQVWKLDNVFWFTDTPSGWGYYTKKDFRLM